ncbi:hypothetical protein JCM14036_28220 [Desulfotomaculum defluvii]
MSKHKNFFPPGRGVYTNKEILKEFEKFLTKINPNIQNNSSLTIATKESETVQEEIAFHNKQNPQYLENIAEETEEEEIAEDTNHDIQVSQSFIPEDDIYQIIDQEILDNILEDTPDESDIVKAKWIKTEAFDKIKEILPKDDDSFKEHKEELPEIIQEVDAIEISDEEGFLPQGESKVTKTDIISHKKGSFISKNCAEIKSKVLESCLSEEATNLLPIIVEPVVAKIPVVLAEFQVQLFLNSTINLPEPALEIKEIKKNVKLAQCLLLQEPGAVTNPGNLFIKGFLRKNIDYATPQCTNSEGICGDIRHCTVDVPFSCVTTVTYQTLPLPIMENSVTQFQFSRKERLSGPGFAEKDQLLSGDMTEFNQVSMEYFNELPYCEMVNAKILEYDEFIDRSHLNSEELPVGEKKFRKIEEKVVLHLTLKLLQNQQVLITPAPQIPEVFSKSAPDQTLDEKVIVESQVAVKEKISIVEETSVQVGDIEEDINIELINIAKLQQSMENFLDKDDVESS